MPGLARDLFLLPYAVLRYFVAASTWRRPLHHRAVAGHLSGGHRPRVAASSINLRLPKWAFQIGLFLGIFVAIPNLFFGRRASTIFDPSWSVFAATLALAILATALAIEWGPPKSRPGPRTTRLPSAFCSWLCSPLSFPWLLTGDSWKWFVVG